MEKEELWSESTKPNLLRTSGIRPRAVSSCPKATALALPNLEVENESNELDQ